MLQDIAGLEMSDGTLSGVKDVLKAEEMLANSIAETIKPAILPEIEIVTIDKKDLLVGYCMAANMPRNFWQKKESLLKNPIQEKVCFSLLLQLLLLEKMELMPI